MANPVQQAKRKAEQARARQSAAWAVWNDNPSAENMAAWDRAVAEMRAAENAVEDAADRWEAWEAAREDQQADWWVAARCNARAA